MESPALDIYLGIYRILGYRILYTGYLETWFNGRFGSAGLTVGLHELTDLFQSKFHYFINTDTPISSMLSID